MTTAALVLALAVKGIKVTANLSAPLMFHVDPKGGHSLTAISEVRRPCACFGDSIHDPAVNNVLSYSHYRQTDLMFLLVALIVYICVTGVGVWVGNRCVHMYR